MTTNRPSGGPTDAGYEELVDLAQQWLVAEANDGVSQNWQATENVEDGLQRAEIDHWESDVRPVRVRRLSAILVTGTVTTTAVALSETLPALLTGATWAFAFAFVARLVFLLAGWSGPSGRPHYGRPATYKVLPEVGAAADLVRGAPKRLADLNASPQVIAQVEAAGAVVERELPRLGNHLAWTYDGRAYEKTQHTTVPYARIMRAAAETVLVLRLAEEQEFALTTGGSNYGPWGSTSLIGAVRELGERADMVRGMTTLDRSLEARIDDAAKDIR